MLFLFVFSDVRVAGSFLLRVSGGANQDMSDTVTDDPNDEVVITSTGARRGTHDDWSSGAGGSHSETVSLDTQRWTEFLYRMVPEQPVYYSLEEELNKAMQRIMRQANGEAQLFFDPKLPTIPLAVLWRGTKRFPVAEITPSRLAAFKERVYSRLGVLTAEQVRTLLEGRHTLVLDEFRKYREALEQQAVEAVPAPASEPVFEAPPKLAPKSAGRKAPGKKQRNKAAKQGPDLTAPA